MVQEARRMLTAVSGIVAPLTLILATCTGCAFSNHEFDTLPAVGPGNRGIHLAEALGAEHETGKHRDLYDVGIIPLLRTRLNHFEVEDDKDLPAGYVETEFRSYLPLFSFVDADVRHYDSDRRLYESHSHRSYLWGLFQTHGERVDTERGLREQRERTLFWLLRWKSSPDYRPLE